VALKTPVKKKKVRQKIAFAATSLTIDNLNPGQTTGCRICVDGTCDGGNVDIQGIDDVGNVYVPAATTQSGGFYHGCFKVDCSDAEQELEILVRLTDGGGNVIRETFMNVFVDCPCGDRPKGNGALKKKPRAKKK
jgi:hypothetical protein